MQTVLKNLFPELQTFNNGHLNVDGGHHIYYEESGNPQGYPVIFLHGGPGSGCNPSQRRFFDPNFYRIILFDQRGCGKSTPLGEVANNSTDHLIADIEALRHHLNISDWLVFGGSWGSTLALAYALQHAHHVSGLILRGIFLSRPEEIQWFLQDAQQFYPEAWNQLVSFLPEHERHQLLDAYAARIFDADPVIAAPAAKNWNAYESSILTLLPREPSENLVPDEVEIARARVQIHYIQHLCFVDGENILENISILSHLPISIVQGRYDMVCPPISAWQLKNRLPNAQFTMVADAGHSAMEAGITSALVNATEAFKQQLKSSE
jgi:proline iminopeptidase